MGRLKERELKKQKGEGAKGGVTRSEVRLGCGFLFFGGHMNTKRRAERSPGQNQENRGEDFLPWWSGQWWKEMWVLMGG